MWPNCLEMEKLYSLDLFVHRKWAVQGFKIQNLGTKADVGGQNMPQCEQKVGHKFKVTFMARLQPVTEESFKDQKRQMWQINPGI